MQGEEPAGLHWQNMQNYLQPAWVWPVLNTKTMTTMLNTFQAAPLGTLAVVTASLGRRAGSSACLALHSFRLALPPTSSATVPAPSPSGFGDPDCTSSEAEQPINPKALDSYQVLRSSVAGLACGHRSK